MDLAPGSYSLRASKPGFEAYDHSVVLQAGQTLSAPINLALSAVQQQVVVNGGTVDFRVGPDILALRRL